MSFTWTGNGDGASWGNAKNWNPSTRTPGSCTGVQDSVDIPIEANITGAPAASFQDFTIDAGAGSNGTLTGGPLTVTGHLEWDGSSVEATINLPAGSTGTIAGPANIKSLGGGGLGIPGTLEVSGTLTLNDLSGSGGNLGLGASIGQGQILIEHGGTLIANGANNVVGASCCGGTKVPTVKNLGTIDVTSGHLATQAALFYQLGHLDVAANALLDANAPTTLGNSSSYTGSGQMLLDLGAVPSTLAGTLSLGSGFHLDLGPQACLQGTGTITGLGSLDFTGGNLAATLTVAAGAFMHVTGPGSKDLRAFSCGTADGTVVNKGRILVDQGSLSLGGSGTITTDPGGTFAVAPGATVTTDVCCLAKNLLVNLGTLQVTAPPKGVASGTPALVGPTPFKNAGTISVTRGQQLLLSGGPALFESGTTLTGPGGTTAIEAPATAAGTVSIDPGATLDLSQNGSIDGQASIAGSGAMRWSGGSISGTVSVAKTVAVTVSGAGQHFVVNRPDGKASVLTTHGPVTVSPGTAKIADAVLVGPGDQWINAGTLTVARQTSVGSTSCCGPTPGLTNTGTMVVAAAGGQASMSSMPFVNSGTLNLRNGMLSVTSAPFRLDKAGTVAVTFTGAVPGVGFGQLVIAGAVTLAGILNVGTSNFKPPAGKAFLVLGYGSHTGTFSKLTGTPAYRVVYHGTGMDVVFR